MLSIVIPVYNEEDNVRVLYNELKEVIDNFHVYFRKLKYPKLAEKYSDVEILFVDDGSTDNTLEVLKGLDCTTVVLRKNFGQSSALHAGFDVAKGDVVVSMDGDLQNDPRDVPRLLVKLEQGYDCVCGWRKNRKDNISKIFFSLLAGFVRRRLIGDKIHDFGCTLRAYKKEAIKDLDLRGEMHRYIPAMIKWRGFKITEIVVRHRQRKYGSTKYSFDRLFKGGIDLFNIWFYRKYSGRPLHIFGALGLLSAFLGGVVLIMLIALKIMRRIALANSILPLLSVFMVIMGMQFFFSGILADIMIKSYYSNGMKEYSIKKIFEK